MVTKATLSIGTLAFLVACSETPIIPGLRDVPRPSGFAPSVAEELVARQNGDNLTPQQARDRLDEFRVSSDATSREWPVNTITYKRFQNPGQRAIYLRRALGRFAFIKAKERSTGVTLDKVRRAAKTTAPSTAGEWWAGSIHGADLTPGEVNRRIALPDIVLDTVKHSPQIAAFGDLPAIRGTAIQEARGRFVPEFFAEASTSRENTRATSPAIASGAARSITDEDEVEFGVRSRLLTGGEISISQRLTNTDTNRTAFIPGEQTTSETTIALVQPLLRGAGVTYNDGPRRIANLDTQIATEEFRRQAEAHLLETERAYWNLYIARAVFLQTSHLAGHGERLARQARVRSDVDADPLLVNRAESLSAEWRADAVRAKAAVDNAELRLAALVNSPRVLPANLELLPISAPNGASRILSGKDTIEEIFVNRPELQQAILQYEAALLREGLAANDSLPELDLVLEFNSSGGADGGSFSNAFDDEDNGSGHLIGLTFSVPLGFDERDARYKRRRLETIQQERQVLSVISTILAEVDVSANEYIIASQDLVAQRRAQLAAQRNLVTLRQRWNDGVGQGQNIAVFSALLDAYERVQLAEQSVATARGTREIAAANLARARGVLLKRWGLKTDVQNDIRSEPTYKISQKK
ncbi:MAG: TolC family protein [Pseudomonadota bacterium]